ncbi:holin [Burkholderia gladioli]|uniref:holin n=1 Tax=Burkholderia gladioli TaxID=28095 RepID=UPI00163FA7F1|nr:holin [Burkholderia gladioli]
MVTIFFAANLVVLLFCIWISLSDDIVTGWWGTLGFSVIGLASALNTVKPLRHVEAIDVSETMLMCGLAIVCIWVMARKFYWWRKSHGTH